MFRGRRCRSQKVDVAMPSISSLQEEEEEEEVQMGEQQEEELDKAESITWSPSHSGDEGVPAVEVEEEEGQEDMDPFRVQLEMEEHSGEELEEEDEEEEDSYISSRLYPSLSVIDKHLVSQSTVSHYSIYFKKEIIVMLF